jgi:hypothetical protein
VNIIAGKPIGRVEVGYVLAQFALLPLQPLDFGFFRGKINQKALDDRRYRCIALGRDHASPPVRLVVK